MIGSATIQAGYRYALSLTHNNHNAEDIVQEACLKIYKKMGRIENKSLLFVTIRNLFIDRYRREQIIRFEPPSHVWLDVGVAAAGTGAPDGDRSKGITHTVVDAITPETDTTTHYFWTFPRNYRVDDAELDEFLHVGVQNTFYEDQEMLEGQQRNINADPNALDVDINADGASIQARNAVLRLLEQEQTLRDTE